MVFTGSEMDTKIMGFVEERQHYLTTAESHDILNAYLIRTPMIMIGL